MAFEGLSSRLQEITRKLRGKARISESDLKEMLREVKLGICMGNGSKEAKESCDYVCEDIHNDGIMLSLKKFGVI